MRGDDGRPRRRGWTPTRTAGSWTRCCAAPTRSSCSSTTSAIFGPLPTLNPEDLDVISRPIDFLGVNYYNPTYVRESAERAAAGRARRRRAGTTTAMGWPVDAERAARPAAAAAGRLRRPRDLDHRERRGVRRREARRRRRRGPVARRVPRRPPRGAAARGRRRRQRPPLPRVVAARQLRVGARLRQALRDRARRLRHAGADPEAQRALVPGSHRACAEGRVMASIAFEDVSQGLPDGTRAVDGLDLEIADGEFTILVGPSGLGQVDRAADGRGARGRVRRVDHDRRARGQRRRAQGPRHRDGLPVLRAVPAHERRREHGLRAEDAEGRPRRRSATRVGRAASRLGIGELLERRPRALSRRSAPAGRAGARDRALARRRS